MNDSVHTSQAKGGGVGASDIPRDGWIDRWIPAPARPYLRLMRLDRPIGTWLLLFPCWWGASLAAAAEGRLPNPVWILLFGLGAVVMRGAGCVVNDLADRDFDGRVARTADRPIPSGAVSVPQALAFLLGLLLLGLAILLQFNWTAVGIGAASLALVFTYPFMKRITYWPQAFLGLTFNWGALVGWAAETGDIGWPSLLLYVGGLFWTLGYDTIYAHQDKEDDALIGVKSSALKLGDGTRPWLFGFYAGAVLLWAVAFILAGVDWPAFVGLATAGVLLFRQAARVDIDRPADCLATFKANRFVGWGLLAGLLAAGLSGVPSA